MADVPEPLKKQVGPFPVYGWLLIIGAGVGLGLVLRRTSLFAGGSDAAELSDVDESGSASPSASSGGPVQRVPVSPAQSGGSGSQPASPSGSTPTTNAEWSKRAVELLVAQGIEPTVALSAVGKYLDGGTLNYAESQALNIAVRLLGAPPEYVPSPQIEQGGTLPGGRPPIGYPTGPDTFPPIDAPGAGIGRRTVVVPNDGDIAQFVTDFVSIEWIPPSGPGRIPSNITNRTDANGFPIPDPISRAQVDALSKRGPAPQYPAEYSGPRTAW